MTTLVIRHTHETNNGHVGIQQALAATRENYWIVKWLSAVKKAIIKGCIMCKSQRNPLYTQQMVPDKAPFSFVRIDYVGPLIVKAGRTHLKRYGCLFTRLTIRAFSLFDSSFLCRCLSMLHRSTRRSRKGIQR